MSAELSFLSVRDLGALLRSGETSPIELTKICLERLDSVGRSLNAVVSITEEIALREAALAEAELRDGLDRGPLHGIPYGAKDILTAVWAPTTWGAAPFRNQVLTNEATVVRRLRDAGAILAAKVATVELAGGMGYDNPDASFTGAPTNPWDITRWTNGSSSGPSSVVAAGAVPFAIGSDTSGSILLPAAWTGTAGLRATYGRVSRFGAMTLCWTLDRLGPLCRTADDCGLVLQAIAGHDPHDSSTLRRTYRYERSSYRRAGFRLGLVEGGSEGVETEVAENFSASLDVLQDIAIVDTVRIPDFPYTEVADIIGSAEAYSAFDEFIAAGRTAELTASKAHGHRLAGAVLPAHDYIRAQRIRRRIADGFDTLARGFDALIAPSLGVVASGADQDFEYMLPAAFPRPVNLAGVLTGSPTISILNGFSRDGLPTGIQFAGARFQENAILDVARALEGATGWGQRRPPGLAADAGALQ